MKCIYCNSELPSNANFCPICLHQIVCQNCKEPLLKDAAICVYCGKPVSQNNSPSIVVNTIEFSENENGRIRTLKAAFSDSTADNVMERFAGLLPFSEQSKPKELSVADKTEEKAIEKEEPGAVTNDKEKKTDDLAALQQLLFNKNGEISINSARIKGRNKSDFVNKVSLMYLYYKELKGKQKADRKEFNNFIRQNIFSQQTFTSWLYRYKRFFESNGNLLSLKPAGREKAQQLLHELSDFPVPDNEAIQNEASKINKDTRNVITAVKANPPYSIVPSLNLKPADKKSLADFMSQFSANKSFEYNLLFVYYMEKILGEQNIGVNHIYTCYKDLNLKTSKNIYQNLLVTRKQTDWISTKKMNDLKVTQKGESMVENEMVKK